MNYDEQRALELLRAGAGYPDAGFREEQEEAIRHIISGEKRLLVVQKTGWGKSFVYFIAAKLLREAGYGPALLISPLLSLMRNQISAAERMGVRARTVNSNNTDEWKEVETAVKQDEVDILLISPERLANQRFLEQVLENISDRIALLVIDEAHCISDWGHDFRPDYRRIERIIRDLPPNLRVLATTATANDRVIEDMQTVLGPNLVTSRGDLARPSLMLQTIRLRDQAQRLAWLAEHVPGMPGNGIIYTLTIHDAEQVAAWLRYRGLNVVSYTKETENREQLEQHLLDNKVKALVATVALGMGFDKPDLAFVIHYQTPGSVVAYYQQVGRAGRAFDAAYGVLLSGTEETDITDYFTDSAFPTPEEAKMVLNALEETPEGLSVNQLLDKVNIKKGRMDKTLKLLALESPAPIAQQNAKWQLTAATLAGGFWQRVQRVTELRRNEQQQMQTYVDLPSGHMKFLVDALDGTSNSVPPPDLPLLPTTPNPALVREASLFLRRAHQPIEPRKRWPAGALENHALSGNIDAELRALPGKALCRWGDAGWGEQVQWEKYQDDHFSDDLVTACVEMMKQWQPAPDPAPQWVTCIPSRRHPTLVPDFARRLAAALELPFHPALVVVADRPAQKGMANSWQQARNVDGALGLSLEQEMPAGPVLLVDDMVDSRWTITVAAWLLRSHGGGVVWPLVLANARGRQ